MKDFKKIHNFHFVGIGGVSMSAIAKLLLSMGKAVSGSDATRSAYITSVARAGGKVRLGKFPSAVRRAEFVVYTVSVSQENADLVLARSLNIPIVERAVFLGMVAQYYKNIIAVSGTHGKTSTTAMLAECLVGSGRDPTVHLGGHLKSIGGNLRLGVRNIFLTEACEFNKSFLHLFPHISVITNIEPDHMDCYKDKAELVSTFKQFAHQTKSVVVLHGDVLDRSEFKTAANLVCFGLGKHNDVCATNIASGSDGRFSFELICYGKVMGIVRVGAMGKHQVLNALATIAVCVCLGLNIDDIKQSIQNFSGVERRFQLIYENETKVFHDYAHHPTEIKAAISTARLLAKNKVICVFEPHTFTRTKFLWEEFKLAFEGADELYLLPTYAAREEEIIGARAQDMAKAIAGVDKVQFVDDLNMLHDELRQKLDESNVIIFMGAGNIEQTAHQFVVEIGANPLT